jgi:hypothetical protein
MNSRTILTRVSITIALVALLATAVISEARRARAADLFPTPWVFGMIGLTQGQTIRLNVVNLTPERQLPPGPCRVVLSFLDAGGQPFTDSNGQVIQSEVELKAGESAFLDLNGDGFVGPSTNGGPERLQLRPIARVLQEPRGNLPPGPCFPTMEVFDNATGRTSLFAPAQPPGLPIRQQ